MHSGGGFYSFPVDVYSVGVTLFVACTGVEPFAHIRSSVHMMMAIRKGFWNSGMQGVSGIGPEGPEVLIKETRGDKTEIVRRGSGRLLFINGDELDLEISGILVRCVDKDPSNRPNARELAALLNL